MRKIKLQSDRIENQYNDAKDLIKYLMEKDEVSYATYIDDVYKKTLLLSAASFFENEISTTLVKFAHRAGKNDIRLEHLIQNKVIQRQYHTFFNWDAKNTNQFWGMFGNEQKENARLKIDSNELLKEAEQAFITLGKQRNLLVHVNFAEQVINDTLDDLYKNYKKACGFIEFIEDEFINS